MRGIHVKVFENCDYVRSASARSFVVRLCFSYLPRTVCVCVHRVELMKGIMLQQEAVISQLRNAEQTVRTEYQVRGCACACVHFEVSAMGIEFAVAAGFIA
jgi:hypothetical protein